MICHRTGPRFRQLDLSTLDQLIDQLRMMDDLIISAQLRVVVFERIQAMGTGRGNFFDMIAVRL